jgi:hypothetical protein
VCAFYVHLAHETAGAARTRLSLRPLFLKRARTTQTSGDSRRENDRAYPTAVIACESGRSSMPRPLGSRLGVSGILDHPLSQVMTRRRVRVNGDDEEKDR